MILNIVRIFKRRVVQEPCVDTIRAKASSLTKLGEEIDEDLIVRTKAYIEALRRGDYDFVDLGTCDGGGFTIAARQGGRKGLGLI